MKTLRKYLMIITLSVISFQAIAQPISGFGSKIQGVYLDHKTQELVYLHSLRAMFYMVKPTLDHKSVKIMDLEKVDSLQRTLQIKFFKSNYVCSFAFASDLRTFICTNPDGTRQRFQRVESPIKTSFAQFVSQFPVGSSRMMVPQKQPKTKVIPIETVMKFLIKADHYHFFPLWDKMSPQQVRMGLYAATTQSIRYAIGYYFTYHYVKRLPISDRFYTLLFYVTGGSDGELGADYTFLVNFTKQGQFIDYLPIGYTKGFHIQYTKIATANISGNYINQDEVIVYHDLIEKERKVFNNYKYKILPDGHIQMTKKWSSNTAGQYQGVNNDYKLVISESGYYIGIYYCKKVDDHKYAQVCKIIENNEAAGRFVIQLPQSKQTQSLRFNLNRDEVILTKADGTSQRFRRVKK